MLTKKEFAQALASGDRRQLYELSRRLATDAFLDQGYQAYRSLTNGEKRSAEDIADIYEQDRLDGLLMLITEKRMPAQPCFGPSMLGSSVSDYDYARTFLLKNLRATGTPGLLKGAFSFRPDMTKCLGCNPDIGKYPEDNEQPPFRLNQSS